MKDEYRLGVPHSCRVALFGGEAPPEHNPNWPPESGCTLCDPEPSRNLLSRTVATLVWNMNDPNIRELRRLICWCFAFTSLLQFLYPLCRIALKVYRHSTLPIVPTLLYATLFLSEATIFGVAWWTVWRGRSSARAWGIAASFTYFLIFFHHSIFFPSRIIWGHHWGPLVLGVLGMVAFLRRDEGDSSDNRDEPVDSK